MLQFKKTDYDKRFAGMKAERDTYLGQYRDVRDYIYPFRGRFENEKPNDGKRRDQKIYNNRPMRAARIMAFGMMAGITSPARPWFRLATFDNELMEREDVRLWLDAVQRKIRELLSRSNFYDAMPVVYQELVLFGTAAMMVMEDNEDAIRFYTYTAGTYMVANDHRMKVRTFAREYSLRPDQVVEQFGIENVSASVKAAYESGNVDNANQLVKVRHFIHQNLNRREGFIDKLNMPFASIHYEVSSPDENKALRVSGYRDFPVMVPRWSLCDTDSYGTECPGMMTLADSKELQSAQYTKKDGILRNVKPPLQAPHDLANTNIMNVPGQATYVNGYGNGGGIKNLYDSKIQLGDMLEDIGQTEARINEGFMVDMFLALLQTNRPSDMKTGVADGINEEKMLMLGPVLERLHHELLNPTIDRVFNIADEKGLLPPAPEILKDQPIKIEYTSILAQVQRAVGIGGIERLSGIVGQFAQFKPDVVDKMDYDQAVDEVADMLGVTPKVVRSDDKVLQVRGDRANRENAAAGLASAESAAKTAKDLTQAQVGGTNLLGALTGAA